MFVHFVCGSGLFDRNIGKGSSPVHENVLERPVSSFVGPSPAHSDGLSRSRF